LVGSFILFIYFYYLLFFTDLSQTSDCLAGQVHEGVSVALVMSVMGIFFLLLLLLLCVASCEASIWRVRGQHARGAKEAKSKKEAPFLKRKKSRDPRENESERASERERPTHTWRDAGVFVSFIRFYRAAGKFAVLVFFWSWSSSSSPLGPRSRELPPFIDHRPRDPPKFQQGTRSEE
jgi:hypothetical protein